MPLFSDSSVGARFESIARAVAVVAVAFYVAGEIIGRAVHCLNDWLAGVAPVAPVAPAPVAPAPVAPAMHPLALLAADRFDSVTVRQLRRYVRRSAGMRRADLIGALCATGC